MTPRVVVFDFDGTLTRPGALDFETIRADIDCPPGTPILEYLDSLPDHASAEKRRILDRHETAAARVAEPNDGALELLADLERAGVGVGVLTRNCRASVDTVCDVFGRRFDIVVAREDAPPKPDPAGVLRILGHFGATAGEALVVGDYRFDIEAGRAAGCTTVLLTNGAPPRFSRDDVRWDHAVETLRDLRPLLGM